MRFLRDKGRGKPGFGNWPAGILLIHPVEKRVAIRYIHDFPGHKSSGLAEFYTSFYNKTIDRVKNPLAGVLFEKKG